MISIANPSAKLVLVCTLYLFFAMVKGVTSLDSDEFAFISEPYEMLGGDYTVSYLKAGDYQKASKTIIKSYFFFWQYRTLFAPVIKDEHKNLFAEEEKKFGYVKPESVEHGDSESLQKYKSRLIVPEPDRFYRQGAGKPLLSAALSIPQLALISTFYSGKDILDLQFKERIHPFFILARLVQIFSGLISIILIYHILKREFNSETGVLGAATFAFMPLTMNYFPDLHHDSILIPFFIASSYLLFTNKFVKGGLVYGFALAAKNSAIFLMPAFILYYLWNANEIKLQNGFLKAKEYIILKAKHLVIFGILSLVTLSPFANPLSYVTEILTPITHREYDMRGEDVSKFMLMHDEGTTIENNNIFASVINTIRGFLQFRYVQGFRTGFLFFAILCVLLCVQAKPKKIAMLALSMLLMILPYGLVFEFRMANRYLIFVPYFAILSASLLEIKYQKALMWVLLCLSLLFCIELLTGHSEMWVPATS